MSSATAITNLIVQKPPIRGALKKLYTKGAAALLPEKIVDETSTRQRWKKPIVSRRIANDLRKKSIKEGTYGSYDPQLGIGWDPAWDQGLFRGKNVGNVNWMEVRGFKDTKRERTRESRALRIEGLLDGADDKIAEYRLKQKESKPEGGIEHIIKRMGKIGSK
jgi:hypothetical protein